MRHLLIALLSLWTAAPASIASPPDQGPPPVDAYAAAVRRYVEAGDAAKAIADIQAWPTDRFEAAIAALVTRPDPALIAAASVLQLEIGLGLVVPAPNLALAHLELGERLNRHLRAMPPQILHVPAADIATFSEKWYLVAASTFLMVNDVVRASPFISRALRLTPASLDFRLLDGITLELHAMGLDPGEWTGGFSSGRLYAERVRLLLKSKDVYRGILEDRSSYARARIRLGRVLWLLGGEEAARAELLRAQPEAREPSQQYLATMFLGAIYEQARDVPRARESYELALSIAPGSQAATVALGYLEVMAGRPDRAHELARALLSNKGVYDEWWDYKNGGVEGAALVWLRTSVRP